MNLPIFLHISYHCFTSGNHWISSKFEGQGTSTRTFPNGVDHMVGNKKPIVFGEKSGGGIPRYDYDAP